MKRFVVILIMVMTTVVTFGQTDYRTKKSGNWNDVSIWQVKIDTVWVDAVEIPTVESNVNIRTKHDVTVTTPVTVSTLTVSKNGKLVLDSQLMTTSFENKGTVTPLDNIIITVTITTGINDLSVGNETFVVYSSHGILKTTSNVGGTVDLYSLSAQKLYTVEIPDAGYYEFTPSIRDGIYVVMFRVGRVMTSRKIYFKN